MHFWSHLHFPSIKMAGFLLQECPSMAYMVSRLKIGSQRLVSFRNILDSGVRNLQILLQKKKMREMRKVEKIHKLLPYWFLLLHVIIMLLSSIACHNYAIVFYFTSQLCYCLLFHVTIMLLSSISRHNYAIVFYCTS